MIIRAPKLLVALCAIALLAMLVVGVAMADEPTAPAAPPAPPSPIGPSEPPGVHDTWARVDLLCEQGRYAEGRVIIQQAYDTATDEEQRAFYLRHLGTLAERDARFDQAIDYAKQVMDKYPKTTQAAWAKLDLGRAYIGKASNSMVGRKDTIALGRGTLEQFLKDYPGHDGAAGAMYLLGNCAELEGKLSVAVAQFRAAADKYPNAPEAAACLNRAMQIARQAGLWDDAIACRRRYLELFPKDNSVGSQLDIATLYMSKGDFAGAITEFDKLISTYPSEIDYVDEARLQKAQAYRSLGPVADLTEGLVYASATESEGRDASKELRDLAKSLKAEAKQQNMVSGTRMALAEMPQAIRASVEAMVRRLMADAGSKLGDQALDGAEAYIVFTTDGAADLAVVEKGGKRYYAVLGVQ